MYIDTQWFFWKNQYILKRNRAFTKLLIIKLKREDESLSWQRIMMDGMHYIRNDLVSLSKKIILKTVIGSLLLMTSLLLVEHCQVQSNWYKPVEELLLDALLLSSWKCVLTLLKRLVYPASRTKLFTDMKIPDTPVWGLVSEDVLINEAKLTEDYVHDGEVH